jgi:hypothetical protein
MYYNKKKIIIITNILCIGADLKYCLQEEFEITQGERRICISKKNRQHNGQKKKVQTTIYKTYI